MSAYADLRYAGFIPSCMLTYSFSGPYIAFAGAVWTDRPNVQMLTPAIPCHYHRDDMIIRDMLMRQIGAFRRAMVTLEDYYKELTSQRPPIPTPNPTLPYPTCYTPAASSEPRPFKYIKTLSNFGILVGKQRSTTASVEARTGLSLSYMHI